MRNWHKVQDDIIDLNDYDRFCVEEDTGFCSINCMNIKNNTDTNIGFFKDLEHAQFELNKIYERLCKIEEEYGCNPSI